MITVTDIFAGAGGSSTGIESVPGTRVATAANHWPLAVAVHADNHQQTEHACVDLHMEDPRNFPHTDILWASPECTKWSIANSQATALSVEMGGDPTLFDDVPDELISEGDDEITRSRLLMFDVLRFIEHHHYRAVIVENVVDIATQPKYAVAWRRWQQGLRRLGYLYRIVSLNSMHAQAHGDPAPQSRDRIYVIAWPEGSRAPDIDSVLRPKAWCPVCEQVVASRQAWKPGRTVGRYRSQYVYACDRGHIVEPGWLPASVAIDWSLEGQRIGDRTKPLSPKTMARIREGLRRYGHQFVIEAGGNQYDAADPKHAQYGNPDSYYRAWPITDPLRTLHTSMTKGLVGSLLIPVEGRDGKVAAPDDQPLRTQTCRNELGLLVPSGGTWHEHAYPTSSPLRTTTTRENHGILTTLRGTNAPKLTSDPLDTVAASGNHHGLLVPYYSGSDSAKPTDQPVGTLTTVDRYALVMRNNTGGAEMVTPSYEPLRTLTTAGHQSILEPTTIEPEDCTFRMLEPHEIALGMAFPADYRWQGSKRERVRLSGNAVTPPAARDLVWAVVEALTGEAA
jgi:DNA (cytosine-5)-methyltransferase 1